MFDVLRAMDCRQVATLMGVEVGRDGIACPCCGEATRGKDDRRPPLGFRPDGHGWSCHRCGLHGDAVALAAAIVTGSPKPTDWAPLRQRVAELGLAEERPLRPAVRAPTRPDPAELRDLWQSGRPPDALPPEHPAVAYLRGRGFDVAGVSEMCRILPAERERWPEWWPGSWAPTWRLAVLGVTASGTAESIHARAIDASTPKTRWPVGREASGLLFASTEGMALLTGWPSDRPPPEVVVGEGLTGLLGAGTRQRRPVLCATSGGWSALRDVRWPSGSVVIIATDNDTAGDAYARKIREALPRTVRTRRVTWQDDHDLGDCPADALERIIGAAKAWPTDPPAQRIDAAIAAWGTMSREERVAALAELVEAGASLREVAAERVDRLVTLASGAPGCGAAAKRLASIVGGRSPSVQLGQDWAAGLGLAVEGVPPGWTVATSGVYRTGADGGQVRVLRSPIVVTSRAVDIDGGETQWEVAWPAHDGTWTRRWVERSILADARRIVQLAAMDAPVDSACARDVVVWLGDWEAMHRPLLPMVRSSSRTGWIRDGAAHGFLWGAAPLCLAAEVRIAPGSLLHGVAPELTARGTFAGWLTAWEIMRRHPHAALGVYASIAAALIDHLPGAVGWWLSFAAPTSAGKTSAMMVAASVWGSPTDGVMSTWDTSLVGLERRLAALRGLPCILDDTSRARRASDVAAAMYLLPSGMGRTRGSIEGVRSVDRWRAVGISTSETPLASYAEAGGAAARVLDLWGSPWEADAAADVASVRAIVAEHYGHVGPRVVEHVAPDPSVLATMYAEEVTRFTGAASSPVQHRAAAYVAMLEVAIRVAEAIGLPRVEGAIDRAWGETERTAKAADHAAAAMTRLVTWIVAHGVEMYAHPEAKRGVEWVGVWGTSPAVRPDLLPEILGVEAARAMALQREWCARGWLVTDGDRTTSKVAMGEERVRLLRLTRETWARATTGH